VRFLRALGKWLRRRPLQRSLPSVQPNYTPAAITSAGLFASLASCYTAYVLYDLISPLVAFVLMATLALLALGLSILQGPFVALLGLVAGYLTPMLLATGQPMAWGLFPYLLLLTASGMAIVRYMAWRWLAWAVLAGSLLWPSFWTLRVWQVGDTLPIGLYLLVVAGISLYVLAGFVLQDDAAKSSLAEIAAGPELVFWVTATAIALLAIVLVRLDNYQIVSLAILFALAAGYLYFGRWRQRFDLLAVVAAATSVIAIALWHFPSIISVVGPFYEIEGSGHGRAIGPVIPPELQAFLITASIFGTLHAVGGFAAVWGARRSVVWASISAAVPIVLVIVSYWRIADFTVDFTWGFASIFLAGSALAACMRLQKFNASAGLNEALGLYAAAVVAAISLTLTMTLREAWLTVALSVQLPALAWITGRISVRALYYVAWVVATVVVVRLSFNENILDYHLGGWPILNWVLFGYGIPAISFFYAAHEFRNLRQVKLVNLLEVGGLAFTVLLVTFEIRQLMAGSLGGSYEFAEKAVQMTAWLCMAYGLATRSNWRDRWAFRWAWRTLLLMALGHMSILLIDHDWMHSPSVGELVFLNWLIPAFAVPALFSFLFARLFQQRGSPRLAAVAMIIGLVEFLIFISFEVRQFFNGSILWGYINSDLEHYSYSVAWLLYGGALLAIGMWREVAQIRWASLAIVLVTVAKVFLIDMSALSGLYRVASFVGLGLALIGIGYLYQHFVRGKLVTNDPIPRP
ncbi:MAG: DUF2339 domain-containing protein, partial [Alphaproteobacteria bacterium]|nr:DUF2339 domain-containing protein [Alphaproteobacteria bacterium]